MAHWRRPFEQIDRDMRGFRYFVIVLALALLMGAAAVLWFSFGRTSDTSEWISMSRGLQATSRNIRPDDTLFTLYIQDSDRATCKAAEISGGKDVIVYWPCVERGAARFDDDPIKSTAALDGVAYAIKSIRDGTAKSK